MNSKPRASVIIPTHNRRDSLLRTLACLERQTAAPEAFEVIVVDDGSTDGTTTALYEFATPLQIHHVRIENQGPAAARNVGVNLARSDILAFTEDDVTIDANWLETALKGFEDDRVAIVDGYTTSGGHTRSVRKFENELTRPPAFIPCNLAIRKHAFDSVGGYDVDFFDAKDELYFREDTELGFRLIKAHYAYLVEPKMKVEHPPQFPTFASCARHCSRYVMDALLYRKHPKLYRTSIEVKQIGPLTVRRPLHYVSLLHCAAFSTLLVSALRSHYRKSLASFGLTVLTGIAFRSRYRSLQMADAKEAAEAVGFYFLPCLYLASIAKGALRYRAPGVLL